MKSYPPFEVIVIGGGSAGHSAASTAVELGLTCALIESAETLGGLCILRGCMPSKTLIETANRMREIREAETFAIQTAPATLDVDALRARVEKLTTEFREYRVSEMKNAGYELIRGSAKFLSPHVITVNTNEGETIELKASTFIIATGSTIHIPDIPGLDQTPFWTSDDVVRLPYLPKHLAVVGTGAIGMECAHLFEGLGSKVTMIGRSETVLSGHDPEISEAIERESKDRGIDIIAGSEPQHVSYSDDLFDIQLKGDHEPVKADALLIATGRVPNTRGLNLEQIGILMDRQRIVSDERTVTSLSHIFAVGDCSSTLPIVHLAVIQGQIAATNAARLVRQDHSSVAPEWDRDTATTGWFTHPQCVEIGLNEKTAHQNGIRTVTGRQDYSDQGKGIIKDSRHGFVKVIVDRESIRIIGAAAAGPEVIETSQAIQLAVEKGMTVSEYLAIPHYHPTLVEAWWSAVEAANHALENS
jgi:pyruvate/2-oxoglutarate dehydrogenase complex dihydrolipoamide dehydrogenase (E3) component